MSSRSKPAMSEADLQRTCEEMAKAYGWLVFHDRDSRRNNPGFLDLFMVHPTQGRCLIRELKSEKGRLRPEQIVWLDALRRSGLDVDVWRPEHLHDGTIQRELRPR